MSSIDAAIAAAKARASQTPAASPAPDQTSNLPAQAPQAGGALTMPGTPFGLNQFTPSTMSVDTFLKVKEFGLKISDSDGFFKKAYVIIDPTEIQVTQVVKYGNPAQYVKTFDGAVASNGMGWAQALQQARQVDGTARPYPSADIPMEVAEDVTDSDGKTFEKGLRIGYSLSTTNAGEFDKFKRALFAAGLQNDPVLVEIGYRKRSNAKGHTWGIVTFDLVGPADQDGDGAQTEH